MHSTLRSFFLAGLVAALVMAPAIAQDHQLNLQDAKIQTLIATVSEITGKNFVLDPRVEGTVNVISTQPMNPDQIYELFLSILKVHGLAAVDSGDFVKIMPEGNARQDAIPTTRSGANQPADALITQVVEVKHVSAADLVPLLRQLVPQNGYIVAHPSSNVLVISDRAGNVDRLVKIIHRIDTVSEDDIELIALSHASAGEVVRMLNLLSDANANATAPATKVIADERTNSVLLAGDPGGRLRFRTLISHLDTPLESGGSTQVIYLRYAAADALVPILDNVSRMLQGDAPAGAEESTKIMAHSDTNSLVISAPPAVIRQLSGVIRQLDIRRMQVHVEAIIAEVSDEFVREIGVQWQAAELNSLNDSGAIGGTNFPTNQGQGPGIIGLGTPTESGLFNLGGLGAGLNLGYLSGSIDVQTGTNTDGTPIFSQVPQLSALVSALDADADTNVLSTPSIVTLDHQEAVINVGQEVPFVTGSFTNTGASNSSVNPFQTIDREDVGITLTVTPHINSPFDDEGDTVVLDIVQEVSSLSNSAAAVDLITNKREIATTVMVPDSQILVLGGLMDETVLETVQKVPGLGDIPVLGNLFRYRSAKRVKRNLMVFIRPTIMRDSNIENAISSSKYNFMRDQQGRVRDDYDGLIKAQELPLLPDLEDYLNQPGMEASQEQ
jgi:general secretion pathway protein D